MGLRDNFYNNRMISVTIVIPCLNEQENITHLYAEVCNVLNKCNINYTILFVDDGSTDETLTELQKLHESDPKVKYLSLSRNFGHQNALKAGLDYASGDCVISLDADLQHPPMLMHEMIEKWQQGYEVVYTLRKETEDISWAKKISSKAFYKLINFLSDVKIEDGAADFRLLDRKVIDVLRDNRENFLFMRGLIAWYGFKQIAIEYNAEKRFAGTSKYSLKKMLKLATNGIVSFSIKPLKISMLLGSIIAFSAFVYALYVLYIALFTHMAVPGWASVTFSVLLVGGINLLMLGIIGEYLGKLFIQSKNRPNYVIREQSK